MRSIGQVHLIFSVTALVAGLGVLLLAAAAAEATTRLPNAPFWGMVAFSTALVVLLGAWVVTTRVPRTLRAVGRSSG